MFRPLLCALALTLPMTAHAQTDRLTPERVFADPDLNGPRPRGLAISPDGALVTYLQPKPENQEVLDLWATPVAGGEPRRLVDAAALSPAGKTLSEAEKARRERARVSSRGVVEYDWDTQGKTLLVPLDGDLHLADAATGQVRRLTETPGDEIDARVSPKGGFVSFVRDQNLYAIDLATGSERALTTGGKDLVSYGVAEFIAQEELDRRTGYWWSPDESRIAYTRVDESGVDVVPRFDIGGAGVAVVEQRYPRPGRPNARVQLFVASLAGGQPVEVDLGPSADIYLARARWSVDGRTLYVQRLSRDQKTLDLLAVDPATGRARVLLTERSPHWVNLKGEGITPLKDGSFLWTSERTGFRHIEHYGADGRRLAAVTSGEWPVDSLVSVDEGRGLVFFMASRDTPLERHLYSAPLAKPAAPTRLTQGAGWWAVTMPAGGGRGFIGTYSDPGTPPQVALYDTAGKRLRWIEENALDADHPYAAFRARHTVPEYGTIKAEDGTPLHYAVTRPPNFDPSKRHPAILLVYGGPHSQQVKREWPNLKERLFLEAGFVVFRIDNRGSDNRGAKFEAAIDRRLGGAEVRDQLAGVRWLKSQPWIDPARVGVSGWSYGGFMTLMLMTEPGGGFAAGAAGAPPTDWRLYDTAYTERYMDTPEGNPEGYAAAEVVSRLPRLQGRLLLLHGMADDNVTFDNSTRVLAALQGASTPFETMLYPGERHGIRSQAKGLHLWRTYLDFFTRALRPEPAR